MTEEGQKNEPRRINICDVITKNFLKLRGYEVRDSENSEYINQQKDPYHRAGYIKFSVENQRHKGIFQEVN